jgi:hypothetical protein
VRWEGGGGGVKCVWRGGGVLGVGHMAMLGRFRCRFATAAISRCVECMYEAGRMFVLVAAWAGGKGVCMEGDFIFTYFNFMWRGGA